MPKVRPWCNLVGVGAQRERFLRESLQELHQQLAEQGQALMVLEGSPELVLPDLISRFAITEVSTTFTPGSYERSTLTYLNEKLAIPLQVHRGNSLFEQSDLPFELEDLPKVFSPFRRAAEKLNVRGPSPSPEALPPPPAAQFDAIPPGGTSRPTMLPLPGGRAAGLRRLRQFLFDDKSITQYKETRNCLDALDGSSTLSPWLANGNLSVREVAHEIFRFERENLSNESTYWLFFELLWRGVFYSGGARRDRGTV
jgi:deoxyribodipyrimidine photo-lyase